MHVTVIAKSPVPGRVKTRLCPPCTIQQAAEVAAAALADTLDAIDEAVATMPVRRVLLLDGAPPAWVPKGYEIVEQSEGGLGERLANGFDVLGPGVILGMDTPHAVPAVIDAVQAVARGIDALGLAIDGGYWVIGLAGVDPAVFGGIEMSTPRTGIDQLQRLHELGRPVTMLPVARDIDTFADVVAVAHSDLGGRVVEVSRRLLSTVSDAADSTPTC